MSKDREVKRPRDFTCEELAAMRFDTCHDFIRELSDLFVHLARHHGMSTSDIIVEIANMCGEYEGARECTISSDSETPRSSLTHEEQELARRLLDF